MAKSMRRFWNTVDVYFAHDRKTIAAGNLERLGLVSLFAAGCLLLMLLFSLLPFTDTAFSAAHRFLLIFNIAVAIAVPVLRKAKIRHYLAVQTLTTGYIAVHYITFLILSAVVNKTSVDTMFAAILLAAPVLFIVTPYVLTGMNFLSAAAYLLLAFFNKEPGVLWSDVRTVCINVVLSFLVLYALTKVRVSHFYTALQLSNLSGQDKVGKVYTHKQFYDICDNLCEMESEESRAMLLFSIDGFDELLEDFGETTREEVARIIGQAIAANAAEADVCGRVRSDTFALFLNSVDSESELRHIDVEIRREIRLKARKLTNREITLSVGGILTENGTFSYDEMMEAAESALYTSQIVGRNTITVNPLKNNEYRLGYAAV